MNVNTNQLMKGVLWQVCFCILVFITMLSYPNLELTESQNLFYGSISTMTEKQNAKKDESALDPIFALQRGKKEHVYDINEKNEKNQYVNMDNYKGIIGLCLAYPIHGDSIKYANVVLDFFSDYDESTLSELTVKIGDKSKTITITADVLVNVSKVYQNLPENDQLVQWSGTRGGKKTAVRERVKAAVL